MKSLNSISQFLKQYDSNDGQNVNQKQRPPVESWQPTEQLNIDIVIKSNGDWWHEGSKITRPKLVSLFASILVKEEDGYYLKTPVQKAKIEVEDAPLLINDVTIIQMPSSVGDQNSDPQYWLEFQTTTNDIIRLDEHHLPYFQVFRNEVRPYLEVRNGLHALISRSVYYHLMEIGELIEHNGQTLIRLYSGGQTFEVLYPDEH